MKKVLIPANKDPVRLADSMKRAVFRESLRRFKDRLTTTYSTNN